MECSFILVPSNVTSVLLLQHDPMFNSISPPDHSIILLPNWRRKVPGGWSCAWTSELELVCLCYYAEISNGNILEIGCNEGFTTAALAVNNPKRRVTGVDYSQSAMVMAPPQRCEQPKEIGHVARMFPNVTIIDQDSSTLLYDPEWQIRFIFIDGGHHYSQIKKDSEKAIEYLKDNMGGYIVWHDYGRQEDWIAVDRVLSEYASLEIQLIQRTSLAFTYIEPSDVKN